MPNEYLKKIAVIIPAFEPNGNLLCLIGKLKETGFSTIIIVNDGSSKEKDPVFAAAERSFDCTVISHAVNLGKGRALKTAFNYILTQNIDCFGIVTIDADGQHNAKDAAACSKALLENPDMLILGSRRFKSKSVPLRSKLGNMLTRRILRFLCGLDIQDTQTGLRAMSRSHIHLFLPLSGERYEFEMSMLLEAHAREIPIYMVPIETVYLDGNSGSHFNPLFDSAKIYYLLLKFILASVSSFIVDISLFSLLIYLLRAIEPESYIFISTLIARSLSASLNYLINKNKVFLAIGEYGKTAVKYIILCIFLMIASAVIVDQLYTIFHTSETFIKITVDTVLFLGSFKIQQKWVFRKKAARLRGYHELRKSKTVF